MLISFEDLSTIRMRHRDKKIVLVGGAYDLFHPGHMDYLESCAPHGDILVVAVNSDAEIIATKGPTRPAHEEVVRARVVSGQKGVDYALVAPEPRSDHRSARVLIEALQPDLFLTSDWNFYEELSHDSTLFNVVGFQPDTRLSGGSKYSTTQTIERIVKQHQKYK